MTRAYEIVDLVYDAVVIGASGAGLRATATRCTAR